MCRYLSKYQNTQLNYYFARRVKEKALTGDSNSESHYLDGRHPKLGIVSDSQLHIGQGLKVFKVEF